LVPAANYRARTRAGGPGHGNLFADHGENLQRLDGQAGHSEPVYTPSAFEIPAFVWTNKAYREIHPEIVEALMRNAAKEVRSHNVFYTVADLMGIRWPNMEAARSFASSRFMPDIAMKHIAGAVLVDRPQESTTSALADEKLAISR
jgi:hypothetical protein